MPQAFDAFAITLNVTDWPEVQAGIVRFAVQFTDPPALTPGKDCCWPSMSITMSSDSVPQFVAEPLTVIAEPGQAASGLHSAAAETQGGALQVTVASACAVVDTPPPLTQAVLNVPVTSTTFTTAPKHSAEAFASKLIEQFAPAARSNGPNVIVWPFGVTAPPQVFETLP